MRIRLAAAASILLSCSVVMALDPIAGGALEVRGSELRIYAADGADDSLQVLNVGEAARVRTCYGPIDAPCGSVGAGDPRTSGLRVVADLSGPELPTPVEVETVPGGSFVLPGFQQAGDYLLYNIRLVEVASGRVVTLARPALATLQVQQILLTSATVTALSLADLAALGVTLDGDNLQGFNFAVGFLFAGELVTLEMPVLFEGTGLVEVLAPPNVDLDNLPDNELRSIVERWTPPAIVPFRLDTDPELLLAATDGGVREISFPLVGAIVLPGSVTFLNQFFEARLIVANGAPTDSDAVLDQLEAALRLPSGSTLRLADTDPPQATAGTVAVLDENRHSDLGPGGQGSAAWILEGLTAGTHVVRMDITGELLRPGREPLPLVGAAQAAVEVADPRFHLTFGHPDVVREGSPYTLFVTVSNLSRATQNLVTVSIDAQHTTGAHRADPDDDFERLIETLAPGASATVEFPLVADVTGRIFASAFDTDATTASGSVQLYTGVGELGIPLSPASLQLPRFCERLAPDDLSSDDLYRWNVRLLGLAYSLAVAPPSATPSGLPRVVTGDVTRRASDLAQAGRRLFLGDDALASLEVLLLDQLGNGIALEEYDELRRATDVGSATSQALGVEIAAQRDAANLSSGELVEHFAVATGYRPSYLAVFADPATGHDLPSIEIVASDADGTTYVLSGGPGATVAQRQLPFGEVYELPAPGGGGSSSVLAAVGHLDDERGYDLVLRNGTDVTTMARVRVVLPDVDDRFRIVDLGAVEVPPRSALGAALWPGVPATGAGGFTLFDLASGLQATTAPSPSQHPALWPSFELIGARQDFGLHGGGSSTSIWGNSVAYLFNRPVDPDLLVPEAFAFRSRFVGHPADDDTEVVDIASLTGGEAAFVQDGGRVVLVRYQRPLPALVDPVAGGPLLELEHQLDTSLVADVDGVMLATPVPPPRIESDPLHVGGLVAGRVVDGTGLGVPGVAVQLLRRTYELTPQYYYLVGTTTTDQDGAYFFEYVEEPHTDPRVEPGFVLRALVPAGPDPDFQPAQIQQVRSTIRRQNRLATVNIALLGRGTVSGTVAYDDGAPVPDAAVTAFSTLFNEVRSTVADGGGGFVVAGMPVGPITVSAEDRDGRIGYATVGIDGPGTTSVASVTVPRRTVGPTGDGMLRVLVQSRPSGDPGAAPSPVAGADVAVYSEGRQPRQARTNGNGLVLFTAVPAGQVTVQAASWDVAQAPVVVDAVLAADTTLELELVLASAELRAVVGQVVALDPVTGAPSPAAGAAVFIAGPGVFDYTDAEGNYRLEGVPTQRTGDAGYAVTAISYQLGMQGSVPIPPVLTTSPEVIHAVPIELVNRRGGLRGLVLDPLGNPVAGAGVVSSWNFNAYSATSTGPDGTFSFDDIPLGTWGLVAHDGDGLQPGRIGFFGEAGPIHVVFGGHVPFNTVRFVGSGVIRVEVGGGYQVSLFIRPQCYRDDLNEIGMAVNAIQLQTDPNGTAEIEVPVGLIEVVAMDYTGGGRKSVTTRIDWPGQVKVVPMSFDEPSIVQGRVVDVDGTTPVPGIQVALSSQNIEPRLQVTDGLGAFRFELVELGGVQVTARGPVGAIERTGRAAGGVYTAGETVDLTVRLEGQGTARGRVVRWDGATYLPVPRAQIRLREGDFPFAQLPPGNVWYSADGNGEFEIAGIHEGLFSIVGRDPNQVHLQGYTTDRIDHDWQVVTVPDVVLSDAIGRLEVLVRDPDTGAPLPESQVQLSGLGTPEATVADGSGIAAYEALPLGRYSVYAFHAPTGRGGRLAGIELTQPGVTVTEILNVEVRGAISGTLWDDPARTLPVGGWNVDLVGSTTVGSMSAVGLTALRDGEVGRFGFDGIPEGDFRLEAGHWSTPRRATAELSLTETAPVIDVDLVLEATDDLHVRLFESLAAGVVELDPSRGSYSVRLVQGLDGSQALYDFTTITPAALSPGHLFVLPGALWDRAGTLRVDEWTGEQRSRGVALGTLGSCGGVGGSGTAADPCQVVLRPKGVVRVTTLDSGGAPVAAAEVVVNSSGGGRFAALAGDDGVATFTAVPAGSLVITANAPFTASAGRVDALLQYDDEVVEVTVDLAPMVAASGVVYLPTPDDAPLLDPTLLVPAEGVIVSIRYGDGFNLEQTMLTDEQGGYRFDALEQGGFTLDTQDLDGVAIGAMDGILSGPAGTLNQLPELILDGLPPRVVEIVPPPGMEGVSRSAVVEITFSERVPTSFLPDGVTSSPYFELSRPRTPADGPGGERVLADGVWSWHEDDSLRPVVRFTPDQDHPFASTATYSIAIAAGPGGVTDLVGRLLSQLAVVGSSFTTADTDGPEVIGTDPSLSVPFDPEGALRFDFNEGLYGSEDQLDGDGADDAARLFWGQDDGQNGWTWQPLPISMILTRSNYSLVVDPDDGYVLSGDTLARRVEVSDLTDARDNPMAEYATEFRIRDANPPVLDAVPLPAGAPAGDLTASVSYTLLPLLSGIDHLPYDPPEGDVGRVDYFLSEPPSDPDLLATPAFSATQPPYGYSFVAAYSGDGVTPRPFPLWVRAVDTSANESNVVRVDMVVLPNAPPVIGGVTVAATAPVAGTPYAGSHLQVLVFGLDDSDGGALTIAADLRDLGSGDVLDTAPSVDLTRPGSGSWADLGPTELALAIPLVAAENTSLEVVVQAIDSHRAIVTAAASPFGVADDATGPRLSELVVRRADDGAAIDHAVIGESFAIELRATDLETALTELRVAVDRVDLFPEPIAVTAIAGTQDRFRSSMLTVPAGLVIEPTQVVFTVEADDVGGNTSTAATALEVAPSDDPTAPVVKLLTPWAGAAWPAEYFSVLGSGATALLLRAWASDPDDDGNPGQGEIVTVEFRGPATVAGTNVTLAGTPVAGVLVAGTGDEHAGEYQAVWPVPDGIPAGASIPFEVRVVDTGNNVTVHSVELLAVAVRKVYEGVATAVVPSDAMRAPGGDPAGAVFLLDGSVVSLYPEDTPGLRDLDSLYLYAGGALDGGGDIVVHPSAVTVPEIGSVASSVDYYPLDLAIAGTLGIGREARLDVDGRGLRADDVASGATIAGEIPAVARAGASHGGAGWGGLLATYWTDGELSDPGSCYGSLRYPVEPGAAGGGDASVGAVGSNGGGVVRIDAATAAVHVAGAITAAGDGSAMGGGAGGSILISAASLRGGGEIGADGGASDSRHGPGGGGRVALHLGHVDSGFEVAASVHARGGQHRSESRIAAGAGTVFLRAGADDPGTLLVAGRADRPGGSTPVAALSSAELGSVDVAAGMLEVLAPARRGSAVGEDVILSGDVGPEVRFEVVGQIVAGDEVQLAVIGTVPELQAIVDRRAGGEVLVARLASRFARVVVADNGRLGFADDLEVVAVDGVSSLVNDRASVELVDGGRIRLAGEEPAVTVTTSPAEGAEIPVGGMIEVQVSAADALGVLELARAWQADASADRTERWFDQPLSIADYTFNLRIPATAPAGVTGLTVVVGAVDGRTATHELGWTVLANGLPAVSLAFAPGAGPTIEAGATLPIEIFATDAESVAAVTVTATEPAVTTRWEFGSLSGTAWTRTVDLSADPAADGATDIVLVATVTDSSGVVVDSVPLVIPVVADTDAPEIAIELTPVAADDTYAAGDDVTITVTASDDVELALFNVSFDGGYAEPADGLFQLAWVAPLVSEPTAFACDATAVDAAGNSVTVSRTITVEPSDDVVAPVISTTCPQSGDRIVAGQDWPVRFAVLDDRRLETVWLTVDGAAVADPVSVNVAAWEGQVIWTVPAGVPAGTAFTLGLHARDFGGNVVDETVVVTTPAGGVLAGDHELDAGLNGSAVTLGPGVFTATGPLELATLELLSGARLTTLDEMPLVVEVAGAVRVACDAVIDVSQRGYGEQTSYPGAVAAWDPWVGASHIGLGAVLSGVVAADAYGSVVRPSELGGGGPPPHGERGGGVVRLKAASLELAGPGAAITADGADSWFTQQYGPHSAGAGGAVWLTIGGEIAGEGRVSASGGRSQAIAGYAAAGGGAIAVEYTAATGVVLDHLVAAGGQGIDRHGAPGSVFLLGPASVFGDLIVDGPSIAELPTVLPGLGAGEAAAGSGGATLVVDRPSVPAYFVGHWLEIRHGATGALEGVWLIETIEGATITLAGDAPAPTVDEGDAWRGIHRFDSVAVRGGARLQLRDADEIGTITLEPGSVLLRANLDEPVVDAAAVLLNAVNHAFTVAGGIGAVTDADGVASARIRNRTSGQSWPVTVAADGSFGEVTIGGTAGDPLELEASDSHSEPRTVVVEIGALPINVSGPALDPDLLEVTVTGTTSVTVRGAPGCVSDPNPPLVVTLRNLTTGSTTSVEVAVDGSFERTRSGGCNDEFGLDLTDSHPTPLTSAVELGSVIGDQPPAIDGSRVSIVPTEGVFRISSISLAVRDQCGLGSTGWLIPSLVGEAPQAVVITASGGFDPVDVSWPTGTMLELAAVDAHGTEGRGPIPASLPGNAGPPAISLGLLDTIVDGAGYRIRSQTFCDRVPSGAIASDDGLSVVAAENRDTPGFAPVPVATRRELCEDLSFWYTDYGFDEVAVDGAIGDEIVFVVTDYHPDPLTTTAVIWTLPPVPEAPTVDTAKLGYASESDGVHLYGLTGAFVAADGPINVAARCWRPDGDGWLEISTASASIASESPLDMVVADAAEGDLVVVSATDAGGATNRVRTTVAVADAAVRLVADRYVVREDDGSLSVAVRATGEVTGPVTVRVATAGGSAVDGLDFTGIDQTLTFGPGDTVEWVVVGLRNDTLGEDSEEFTISLSEPAGAVLGVPSTATVTIVDDETAAPRTVAYSVLPGGGELLTEAVAVDVAAGTARFAAPLVGPDRGDLLNVSGGPALLLGMCSDPRTCLVTAPDGGLPVDVVGGSVVSARAAFDSLAAAVAGADTLLGTRDLAAAHTVLELLCYAGAPDTSPVSVTGWTTSPETPLTIVAPTGGELLSGRQRHHGRWTDTAYRLVADSGGCLSVSGTDDVVIEGLQLACSAAADNDVIGLDLTGAAGRVVVGETLIRLDTVGTAGARIGVRTGGGADVVIRNSMIWDLGDGWAVNHIGIDEASPATSLRILNNTIVGGWHGIQVVGEAVAVNNLVAGANDACYVGPFSADSRRNLASDGSAPNPPAHHSGSLTVTNPTTGTAADFHLGCGVNDQAPAVSSNFIFDPQRIFDGDPREAARHDGIGPAWVLVEFAGPRTITGTALKLTNHHEHTWSLEAADSVADLDSASGSYQLLVDQRTIVNGERAWDTVSFAAPVSAAVFRLTAERSDASNVHLAEWELIGLNPACGAGAFLGFGTPATPGIDVDSAFRVGAWDVGADQATDLEVGFAPTWHHAWEAEGEAILEVVLSEFAAVDVTLRFASRDDGSAQEGEDYTRVEGTLVFAPGEVYKQIRVPLVDDGDGEGQEHFLVDLFSATNARLGAANAWFDILEGPAPVRSGFATSSTTVAEGDGAVPFSVVLSAPLAEASSQGFEARDRTARINLDYQTANGGASVAAGATMSSESSIVLVDDAEAELDESFVLELGWPGGAVERGYPSRMHVRIVDDDLPPVAFESGSAEALEDAGAVTVRVEALGVLTGVAVVDVAVTGGTAVAGFDFDLATPQVTLSPAAPTADVRIDLLDDAEAEGDETVELTLIGASGAQIGSPATATVTIHDDEALPRVYLYWPPGGTVSIDEFDGEVELSVAIMDEITAPVDVNLAVAPGGTATLGADFTLDRESVTFVPVGARIEYVMLSAINDFLPEDGEQATVVLEGAAIEVVEPSSITVEIVDDDPLEGDVYIDPAHVRVDLTTCHPTLVGDEHALVGTAPALTALGYVWSGDDGWLSEVIPVEIGQPFDIPLSMVDLGSGIELEVDSDDWSDWWDTQVSFDAPALDLGLVSVDLAGDLATVTVPQEAITYRLEAVVIEVRSDFSGEQLLLDASCDPDIPATVEIGAQSRADIAVRACHGVATTACTDWLSLASKRGSATITARNGADR